MLKITDEAVDAAAKAMWDSVTKNSPAEWESAGEKQQEVYREDTRATLAAALPLLGVDEERLAEAVINVTSNAMNYPEPERMLGKDTSKIRGAVITAVVAALGGDAA